MTPDRETLRRWLLHHLKERGHGARRALADFLNVRLEAISRMTSDPPTRTVNAPELLRMAEFFGVAPPSRDWPNEEDDDRVARTIPMMGFVGAGGDVDPDFEQVPPDGFEQVELPFALTDEAIGLKVRGDSQRPVFNDGDIVVVLAQPRRSIEQLIGERAAVRTYDGKRMVKEIMRGSKRHTYTLLSLNADPILDVRLAWASEIVAVVPKRMTRLIAMKPHRKAARVEARKGK